MKLIGTFLKKFPPIMNSYLLTDNLLYSPHTAILCNWNYMFPMTGMVPLLWLAPVSCRARLVACSITAPHDGCLMPERRAYALQCDTFAQVAPITAATRCESPDATGACALATI